MSHNTPALSRLSELQAQLAKAKEDAIGELRARRESLQRELTALDKEIAELTGQPLVKNTPGPKVSVGRSVPLQELKALLAAAPDKTLNIRKEGLELRNIKVLASANPHLLRLGGKGPWPTVTLLK